MRASRQPSTRSGTDDGTAQVGLARTPAPTGDRLTTWLATLIGVFGLVAALAVLPLPTVAQTPEIASVLAVAAVALLAGQRWALPIVVLADIALIGALWPRAFLHDPPSTEAQVGVLLGLAGALPGVIALGRTAPALAELVLGRSSRRGVILSRIAIGASAILWVGAPLV
jgi:hypothetical protein